MRRMALTREEAEGLAVAVLGFLAEEPARLGRFLAVTGLEPEAIRRQADTSAFQCAVLEWLLADESLLLVFASEHDQRPERVAEAARVLNGG
jgi:hypothetical protein